MYLTARLVLPGPGGCLYLENLGAIESNKSRHDATTQPNHTARHDTTRALRVRSKNSSGNSIDWKPRLGGGISTSLPLTGGKAGPSPFAFAFALAGEPICNANACNLEQPAAASSQQPAACIGGVPSAPHERVAGGID